MAEMKREEYEEVTVHSILSSSFWLMPATPKFIENGDVPYITSKNIKNGIIDFENVKYISRDAYKKISANRPISVGDILVSMIGTLGQLAVVTDSREFYGQNVYLLRLNNNVVDSGYFCEYFSSNRVQRELESKSNKSTQSYIKANHVEDLLMPLPPLNVQRRIAETLDKVTELISLRKTQLEKLDELVRARFVEMFGDPVANPMGWNVQKLVEICDKITDGTHNSPDNFLEGDYKYITAKNIKKDGLDLKNLTYVTTDVHQAIYSRCNPEYGDVLYIKDGVTTGIATVNTLNEEFSLLSSVALLKQKRNVISGIYLCNVLNSPTHYTEIRRNMGGAAITRLTLKKLCDIRIPIPPLSLQNTFASFVSSVEEAKAPIQQSLETLETLKKSLMQEYFG